MGTPGMITTARLVALVRRFVLHDDEPIVWSKEFPSGPAVHLETTDRFFKVSVVRDWLRVEQAPWVAAVVVATREDRLVDGPAPRYAFLVQDDGTELDLGDRTAVAALGSRLHRGELAVAAYAELLVHCRWPNGWRARVVTDPVSWRGGYPPEANLPALAAIETTSDEGGLRIRFFGSRETVQGGVGGRRALDVAGWSVRVPGDGPATWEVEPVAEEVPLLPPW